MNTRHTPLSILLVVCHLFNTNGELVYENDPRGAVKILHGNSVPESGPGYVNPAALQQLHKVGLSLGIELPPGYSNPGSSQPQPGQNNQNQSGNNKSSTPQLRANPANGGGNNGAANGGNGGGNNAAANGGNGGGNGAGASNGNGNPSGATGDTSHSVQQQGGTSQQLTTSETSTESSKDQSGQLNADGTSKSTSTSNDNSEKVAKDTSQKGDVSKAQEGSFKKSKEDNNNGIPSKNQKRGSKGGSPGMIFGVLGGLCAIAATFGIALFYRKRKEQQNNEYEMDNTQTNGFITPKECMVML